MTSLRASRSAMLWAWALGLFVLVGCSGGPVAAPPVDSAPTLISESAAQAVAGSESTSTPTTISDSSVGSGASDPAITSTESPTLPPLSSTSVAAPPDSSATAAAPAVPPTPAATPTSVGVEAIGLAEPLIELGVLADGTAETPVDYDDAGWFSGGGRPGGIGPTVLLGHVDSLDGPAVFYRLRDLVPGDLITVGLSDGSSATYSVTENVSYEKASFPTFAVFGATPQDILHLVTCGGAFDDEALSYESNIVVTATRLA